MPTRLCLDPTCPSVAAYRGRCQRHARERERQTVRAGYKLYRSAKWRHTRERFLLENPLCDCGRVSEHVHHIVDLADGGNPWSFANLEALCVSCHSRITRRRQHAD